MKTCSECNGKKARNYSCCTGEHVDMERYLGLCPECKEHLGEDECYTCKGTGYETN